MNNAEILQEKEHIDLLFDSVRDFSNNPEIDIEILSMLTYYLCIKVSGFIERGIRIILLEYAKQHSRSYTTRFIEKILALSYNPSRTEIAKLLKKFDKGWYKDYNNMLDNQSLESLDSININRNKIAHGGITPLTFAELEIHYQGAITIVEKLEEFIDTK